MRRVIVGAGLLLLLFGGLIAFAASNLNVYLNENKDWVEKQIESTLARPVAFDAVGLSFGAGLGVAVKGIRIGEDASYGEGDFLKVAEAEVQVAIWPALMGRVEVTRISLGGVSLTVVQDAVGMNTDSLGGRAGPHGSKTAPVPPEPGADADPDATVAFVVGLAEIRSGTLRYVDRTRDPSREVVIDQLELHTTDVGLTRPLDFQLQGAVLGEEKRNIDIRGSLGPLPERDGIPMPLEVSFSLASIRLEALRTLPGLADAIGPELSIAGVMDLSGHVSGHIEDPTFNLLLEVFGGSLAVDGEWTSEGALRLDAEIRAIELGELSRSFTGAPVQVVDGRLGMTLSLTGKGTRWEELQPGLEGSGTAWIVGGILHDVNLVEEALAGFTGIPGLSSELPEKLKDDYPLMFGRGSTAFDRMEGKVEVREGRIQLLGIELEMADFGLRGRGTVSFAGELDLSTRLSLSKAISAALVAEAKPLEHLRNKRDRIVVPIAIRGTLPEISARPDTDEIAAKLGSVAVRDRVDKTLQETITKSISRFVLKNKKKKKKKKRRAASGILEGTPADVDE